MSAFAKVRADPFSKSALGAKIPDGKATTSNTFRAQSAREFTLGTTTQTNPSFFLLIPGLKTSLVCSNATTGAGGDEQYLSYPNHVSFQQNAADVTYTNSSTLEKWRVVSQGTRFQMTNNSDENEGWFEAVRLNPCVIAAEEAKWTLDSAGILKLASADALPYVKTGETWASDPTYVTGKLRDLHQYVWKHNSVNTDHDFRCSGGTNDQNANLRYDFAYDMIAIKMYGRKVGAPTTVAVHCSTNQELIFAPQTILSMNATACYNPSNRKWSDSTSAASPARYRSMFRYFGRYGTGARTSRWKLARYQYSTPTRGRSRTPRSMSTTSRRTRSASTPRPVVSPPRNWRQQFTTAITRYSPRRPVLRGSRSPPPSNPRPRSFYRRS